MKETGLMFKAPLVRAILEGRKTQTRRVIKDQTIGEHWCEARADGRQYLEWQGQPTCGSGVWDVPEYNAEIVSPLGLIGDRIYVRETWANGIHALAAEREEDGPFVYAADGDLAVQGRLGERWKPAIHMPKYAARIWLEITGVRVERLQQITDTDCWAEGAITEARPDQFSVHSVIATDGKAYLSPRGAFSSLWESTGGDWAADPWVWVIDFKTISTNGHPA